MPERLTSLTDGTGPKPCFAVIDRDGRLVAAGEFVQSLHMAAGGQSNGEIAVPQLATLARMVRSLKTPVSRTIIAANGDVDAHLVCEARPDGESVHIAISHFKSSEAAPGLIANVNAKEAVFSSLEADGTWKCNRRLVITDCSPTLSGEIGAVLIGRKVTDVFRLIESANGSLPLVEALAEQHPFFGQEAELRDLHDGLVLLHATPNFDVTGQFEGFSGGVRIKDRQLASRVRPRATPDIVASNSFPARLDAAIRVPLARIIGNADLIGGRADGPLRHDYTSYANDISAAGRHLLRLADDLADLQAVERPGFAIAPDAIDLADIARRAAGLLSVRATDRGVRIDAPQLGDALPANGDFGRALQILVNLIGNAVRYSPPSGMVWVRPEQDGDLCAIVVSDMGKGIAQHHQSQIFEKFHRVDPSEPGGTGLGLYISRKLARAMGGDISVDSAPGQGARFIFTLPGRAA